MISGDPAYYRENLAIVQLRIFEISKFTAEPAKNAEKIFYRLRELRVLGANFR